MVIDNNGHEEVKLEELDKFIHSEGSTDKAFKSQDAANALKLIALRQEGGLPDGAMLVDLPSNRFALGLASAYQGCKEHNYQAGIDYLENLVHCLASVKGKRVGIISDTIIGERRWKQTNEQEGIGQKFKNWMANK